MLQLLFLWGLVWFKTSNDKSTGIALYGLHCFPALSQRKVFWGKRTLVMFLTRYHTCNFKSNICQINIHATYGQMNFCYDRRFGLVMFYANPSTVKRVLSWYDLSITAQHMALQAKKLRQWFAQVLLLVWNMYLVFAITCVIKSNTQTL